MIVLFVGCKLYFLCLPVLILSAYSCTHGIFFREFLTNPDTERRKRGTQLMADILQKLPLDFLIEKEGNKQGHKLFGLKCECII